MGSGTGRDKDDSDVYSQGTWVNGTSSRETGNPGGSRGPQTWGATELPRGLGLRCQGPPVARCGRQVVLLTERVGA